MAYHANKGPYKTKRGKMISGVCAGLSEAYHIDVSIIRLIFLVLLVVGFGTSAIVYIVLSIVLAEQ